VQLSRAARKALAKAHKPKVTLALTPAKASKPTKIQPLVLKFEK
jgi:hypothetical protein